MEAYGMVGGIKHDDHHDMQRLPVIRKKGCKPKRASKPTEAEMRAAKVLPESRTCVRCGANKPITEFYTSRGNPSRTCKACTLRAIRARERAKEER